MSANYIKFLGTAGARFVVSRQLRSSGGIWFSLDNVEILVDPGPGCLIKCTSSKPKLYPEKLSGIILSHKHLDHSSDVNIMIEAMTEGGTKKRGSLFAPDDALNDDPVVLYYIRKNLEKIEVLQEKGEYQINGVKILVPLRHIHGEVETYGIELKSSSCLISYITDTKFFENILESYRGDVLILNVVRKDPSEFDHLCVKDAERIIENIRPKKAVLTHFGMTMLAAKPWEVAKQLSDKTGTEVIAATDGMKLELSNM